MYINMREGREGGRLEKHVCLRSPRAIKEIFKSCMSVSIGMSIIAIPKANLHTLGWKFFVLILGWRDNCGLRMKCPSWFKEYFWPFWLIPQPTTISSSISKCWLEKCRAAQCANELNELIQVLIFVQLFYLRAFNFNSIVLWWRFLACLFLAWKVLHRVNYFCCSFALN